MRWTNIDGGHGPAELVLLVLWPNGQPHERRAMRTILDRFQPVVIRTLDWRREGARERLSALYGRPADALFDKDAEVGEGRCTVVLSVDHRPRYVWARRKPGLANRACYRLKRIERRRSGLNYLHASDTEFDALQFAVRLFGRPVEYYLELKELALQAAARPLPRSLAEIFSILNQRVRYAVLRNWSDLPDGLAAGHGDVDILVDDPAPVMASFPGAWKKHTEAFRVHFHLPMRRGGVGLVQRSVPFDLRHVGDNYYDEDWQRGMLERRVLSPRGFYHLCDTDHFFAVLYHALLHKPHVRADYRDVLRSLGHGIEGWSDAMLDDARGAVEFLAGNVPIQKPADHSVYWNSQLLAAG